MSGMLVNMSQSDNNNGAYFEDERFTMGARRNVWLDVRSGHAVSVLRVAKELWLHPTDFVRQDSLDYAIGIVLSGAGIFTADQEDHRLATGSVFSFGPGGSHAYSSLPRQSLDIIIIDCSGDEVGRILERCFGQVRGVVQCKSFAAVSHYAHLLFETALRGGPYHLAACQQLLLGLLYTIAGAAFEAPLDSGQAHVERARSYMQAHWQKAVTVQEIAEHCQISGAHLCRLFREQTGMTPQQMLHRMRIRHAAQELLAGAAISDLAMRYHYADAFTFSKSFKRVTGLSPKHYLQRINEPYIT